MVAIDPDGRQIDNGAELVGSLNFARQNSERRVAGRVRRCRNNQRLGAGDAATHVFARLMAVKDDGFESLCFERGCAGAASRRADAWE